MKPRFTSLILSLFAFVLSACSMQAQANVGKSVPSAKLEYIANQVDVTGKPYILEFWATWCPPCRQSIPHLNRVYDKFKARGLLIVGVSTEEPATIRAFMKKVPMNYTVAADTADTLSSGFGITGIPHALVVDKTGKIIWEGHPMQLEDSTIEKVLK